MMVMKKILVVFIKEIYLDQKNNKLKGIDHILKKVMEYL